MSTKAFKPKLGRPTAKQTQAIEQTIILTAKTMFLQSGYDQVAMEVVAAKAGVSKGTLYSRYSNKIALFEAVIKYCVNEWSAEAGEQDFLLDDDLLKTLKHHAKTIARSQLNPEIQAFQKLLLLNSERFPEIAITMHDIGYLFIANVIVQSIERYSQSSNETYREPKRVAEHLVSAITGWYMQESSYRKVTQDEIENFAEHVVDVLYTARSVW